MGLCEYPTFSKHLILKNKGAILEERIIQGLLMIPVSLLLRIKIVEQSIFLLTLSGLARNQKNKSVSE